MSPNLTLVLCTRGTERIRPRPRRFPWLAARPALSSRRIQRTSSGSSVRAERFSSATSLADPPLPNGTLIDPVNGITVLAGDPLHGPAAGWDGRNGRISVDNSLVTLPPSGGVQQVQTIPLATRIAAIASGGPRPFIVFDVDDRIELTVHAYGQFINDVPLRRRAVTPRRAPAVPRSASATARSASPSRGRSRQPSRSVCRRGSLRLRG